MTKSSQSLLLAAASLLALLPTQACTENHTTEGALSDEDRALLEQAAEAGTGGLSEGDRELLGGLVEELDQLGATVDALPTELPAPGLPDDQLELLETIADNTAAPEPEPEPEPELDDSRACDSFAGTLERSGEDGVFGVRVIGSTPAVQLSGMYDWTVQIVDAELQPVEEATLVVEPYMPDHGHGSSPVTVRDTHSAGVYSLEDVNLMMGGLWEVRIDVTKGDDEDRIVVRPCVAAKPMVSPSFQGRALYVFATDDEGVSTIAVIDADEGELIDEIEMPAETKWGDAITSPDGSRIFVNNNHADGNEVIVIDTLAQKIEQVLPVGPNPVHLFNPNHGDELWSHSDTEGAFYVFDVHTLAHEATVVAALDSTGHGKLLYDPELTPLAFATNVTSAAAFPIDLEHKTTGYALPLCAGMDEIACTDDTPCDTGGGYTCDDVTDMRCEDGSGDPQMVHIGGTHDKAISPYNRKAYFQCSGGVSGYGIVDVDTLEVLDNAAAGLSGSAVQSPDHRFVLLVNTHGTTDPSDDTTDVLDTMNDDPSGDDYKTLDYVLDTPGSPQVRGVDFAVPGGNANAMLGFVPSNGGDHVYVIELAMLAHEPSMAVTAVDVGTLTPPVTGSANRRGVMGGSHYYTVNDEGAVGISASDLSVTDAVPFSGVMQRVAYADTSGAVGAVEAGSGGGGHSH